MFQVQAVKSYFYFNSDESTPPAKPKDEAPSTEKKPAADDGKTEEQKKKETELEKYWKAVKENPMDFTGWTYLLQFVEQEVRIIHFQWDTQITEYQNFWEIIS